VWERKLAADSDGVNAMLKRDVALGRLGRPEEVAGMALWLASPDASFTTGGIFVIDGGQVRS
jgi:NAD(P)-dependent dehydrogenase (short-subunit alcohol dehydrogenase family)